MGATKESKEEKENKEFNKDETDEIMQKIEDLELVNSVNIALNRGESLEEIIRLITENTKKIFSGSGLATYLLSDDGKYLEMQRLNISRDRIKKIEQLIKIKIPDVRLPLKEGSHYQRVIKERKPLIVNDAAEIKKIITDFVDILPEKQKTLKKIIKKLVPKIYGILNMKSMMAAPLVLEDDVVGLIDISGKKSFTESDLGRINIISRQLVSAINKKKTENKLEDLYEKMNQVFNASVDGMVIIGRDFSILKSNKVMDDLFGLESKDTKGKKCYELFGGTECNTANCVLKRILNGEEYITIEEERENRQGENITCVVSANPVRNQKGEIIGIIECFKDVTMQKKAYEEIKENEERYRELFDNMSSGVVVYEAVDNGKDFIIKNFNKAAQSIEKISEEEVIGKSVLKVFPGLKDLGLFDVFKRVYKTGRPEKHPISFYRDDRISGWRRNYVYRLPSGELVAVYDDMTRQKQAEKLLKESEEFSSSLMENSPNPIYVLNNDFSIKYANPAMQELVGLKSDELLGKKAPFPWWPGRLRSRYIRIFKEDMKHGVIGREFIITNNKGEESWIETYNKLVLADGKLKYVIINWFDITHRKLMEDNLKESYRKLEKALQGTINALGSIVEKRDPYTSGHQKRVSKLAVAISKELGLSSEVIECIKTAADIHDIGKINIPVSILTKPGKLTDIEFDLIKTHPDVGYEMVKEIEFPRPVAEIILEHHEKLDGSGYPRGLEEKDIMFEAKILTVSDVVEAMSSDRPYRPALGLEIALNEVKRNKGKLYDPRVVDACVKVVTKKGFKFD